jgi:hypothetical protein
MGGPETSGMWAAHDDGSGSITLIDPEKYASGSMDIVWSIGWISSSELIMVNYHYDNPSEVLAVDITTGASRTIFNSPLSDVAYSPETGVWLISPPNTSDSSQSLRLFTGGQFTDIPGYEFIQTAWWWEKYGVFIAMGRDITFYTVTPSGEVTLLPADVHGRGGWPNIYESPDGATWAWFAHEFYSSSADLWVGEPFANPRAIVKAEGDPGENWDVKDIIWSPDSQRLYMLTDRGMWYVPRPDFEPVLLVPGLFSNAWNGWDAQWIPKGN